MTPTGGLPPEPTGVRQNAEVDLYREIPSLREYVLIEQSAVLAEVFRRTEGHWLPERLDDLDARLAIDSLGLTLPLREIYRQVF